MDCGRLWWCSAIYPRESPSPCTLFQNCQHLWLHRHVALCRPVTPVLRCALVSCSAVTWLKCLTIFNKRPQFHYTLSCQNETIDLTFQNGPWFHLYVSQSQDKIKPQLPNVTCSCTFFSFPVSCFCLLLPSSTSQMATIFFQCLLLKESSI